MSSRTERQKLCISNWVKKQGRATVVAATGVGKTRIALMTIQSIVKAKPNSIILIAVPTEVLKQQWTSELTAWNICDNCRVEIINTIVTKRWNCDLLVIDEVHLTASAIFSQIFNVVSYNYILCLTATIERLDGKEIIIKQFAPVCDVITMQEAIENGWVAPISEYCVLIDVDLTEYIKVNNQFNGYFAYFGWDFNTAMKCATDYRFRLKYAKDMKCPVKEVTATAMGWMNTLQKRKAFIANHPKKLEICKKILNARKDKKCIVFAPTIKICEQVGTDYVLHSQKKKKENAITLNKFNQISSGSIGSSKALNTGVDVKGLSVGIIMNVNSSKITKTQTLGRVCRFEPGKKAEMFTLVLRGTQEVNWFHNSNTTSAKVINEQQLDSVLNGTELDLREHENIENIQYRF